MPRTGNSDNLRLTLIAAGFVVLLGSGIGFLLFGGGSEASAVRFIHGAASDFQDDKPEEFADRFTYPLTVTLDGTTDVYTRERLLGDMAVAHSRLTYLRIRPEDAVVRELPARGELEVDYFFHWTASGGMYPNLRRTSEGRDGDGPPALVSVRMRQEGNSWTILQVHLDTRR